MPKWLVGIVLALTLVGSAATAMASTRKSLYRTTHQAELFLEHDLKSWAHNNLGQPHLRSAFCVNGSSAKPEANERYHQGRVNHAGTHVYRTFACTLNAVVKDHSRVFGLYLVTTRSGWRVTAL